MNMDSVLEAEVNPEIIEQLNILDKALKANKALSVDYENSSTPAAYDQLNEKVEEVGKYMAGLKTLVRNEHSKNEKLVLELRRGQKVANRLVRMNEMSRKHPDYAAVHSIDYLHDIALDCEKSLFEHNNTVEKMKKALKQIQDIANGEVTPITGSDLLKHIARFDQIFSTVASQVYSVESEVERLKDAYMEQRRSFVGNRTHDPFKAKCERDRKLDAFSSLKGMDPFPKYNTILSISEYLPKQAPTQTGTPFGAANASTMSLFGGIKPQQTAFPSFTFNPQQPSSTGSALGSSFGGGSSLFGLKTPTSSAFGTSATAAPSSSFPSLTSNAFAVTSASTATASPFLSTSSSTAAAASPFGVGVGASSAGAPGTSFSNTLSSASSGTLFKGSSSIFGK